MIFREKLPQSISSPKSGKGTLVAMISCGGSVLNGTCVGYLVELGYRVLVGRGVDVLLRAANVDAASFWARSVSIGWQAETNRIKVMMIENDENLYEFVFIIFPLSNRYRNATIVGCRSFEGKFKTRQF